MSVTLRPARSTDAGKTGDILWQFQNNMDWMPKLHTAAETIAFCGRLIDRGWVTVAIQNGQVVGFLARDGEEISALYLLPRVEGQGVGRALLDYAKSQSPRLHLWAFQANAGAQRFYERQGFVEKSRGDGHNNEEQLPDIQYVWPKEAAQ